MTASGPLDHAAMERLRRLGDEEFVRSMIELFFEFVSQKLAEARRAWEAEDLAGAGAAGHAIKSTAGNAGAIRVQELALRLEEAGKSEDKAQVEALLGQLESAFAEVTPYLEAERAKLGG